MSADTPTLAYRIHLAILYAFDRDRLDQALLFGMQERLDTLVADKNFHTQVFELLEELDRTGRVPALLRWLHAERQDNEELAVLWAEAEQRQGRVGAGRPILGRIRQDDNPVPLQKPLRTPHFVGREQELTTLIEEMQPGRAVTLCGPGGMGKSALAAEVIWRLSPGDEPPARFPDGIIFHTFYHQPQAGLALEKIARAYGFDPRPSPRDAALQALAGKKALILLDGTEQADDLPAVLAVVGACGVLVTTRRHADAPDEVQDVEPLPQDESLKLLRSWSDGYAAEDVAANDIVLLLGGLPLALYLCGRYLAQKHQTASEYVGWLKTKGLEALHFGERPTTSIPLLLLRSLEQVSTEAKTAFAVAGILALAPFEREVIVAALTAPPQRKNWQSLWQRKQLEAPTEAKVTQILGELVDYGLLLRPTTTYLVTHTLAHSYARTQCPLGPKTVNSLALYFAAKAEAESAKGLAGYAALNDQRAHIVAVQAAALKAEQWNAVRQITWKVEDYLDLQGHFTDRQTIIQAGLVAARASNARYDEAEFLNRHGIACVALGETHRAVELYKQALAIDRKIGDLNGEGITLGNLGNAYAALGETHRAVELYKQALAIDREIGDRRREGIDLGCLGLAYADLGETHRAIDYHQQDLTIRREIGDRRGEGNALGNLGLAYADIGETRRAIDLYEKQLDIVRKIGDRRGEGDAQGNLGNAYYDLGDTRRAIDLYEKQLDIVRKIGDRRGEGNALGNMGIVYYDLGEPHRAIELYEQQLVIVQEIGDRRGEGNALGNIGLAYADLNETSRAIGLYKQALVIHREIGDRHGEALTSWNLGLAYQKENDLAQAIACMQLNIHYLQDAGHHDAEAHANHVDELRARFVASS